MVYVCSLSGWSRVNFCNPTLLDGAVVHCMLVLCTPCVHTDIVSRVSSTSIARVVSIPKCYGICLFAKWLVQGEFLQSNFVRWSSCALHVGFVYTLCAYRYSISSIIYLNSTCGEHSEMLWYMFVR